MGDTIRTVDYFYVEAADKPGEAARMLDRVRAAGVNLLAFTGFPAGRKAQLDFIPENAAAFRALAKAEKWKVKGPKKGFLIQGEDRVGALAEVLGRIAAAKVNVTATDAVCAGGGRFGVILWVPARDVSRAAKALGAV